MPYAAGEGGVTLNEEGGASSSIDISVGLEFLYEPFL